MVSGGLIPLGFSPFGWWPLLIVSFFALLVAVMGAGLRRSFYLGMLHGVVGYGLSLYWFYNLFGVGAVTFIAILGLFNAIFCLLFNLTGAQTRSAVLKVFIAATLWTAIEFYRSELFFLRFPWITPGTGLGPTFLSPVLGVYGTSFVVIGACAALTQRKTFPLGLLLAFGVVFLGIFRPGPVALSESEGIRVLLVQSEKSFIDAYMDLTRSADGAAADLVVWPQYALPYDVRKRTEDFGRLKRLCDELEAILVVGTKTEINAEDGKWHNTALTLDSRGVLGEYYKVRPVHLFNDGVPGRNFAPVQTQIGFFATPICFDCDYSAVSRKMADLGAEFFAVPSYDAKSWSWTQHLQHALMFRLRAAENGRWLACAASSGVSQVIDPHGNARKRLSSMDEGVVACRINKNRIKTFFTRFGWLFPWAVLLAAGMIVFQKLILLIASKHKFNF